MAASAPTRVRSRAVLLAAAFLLFAGETPAQILPWEVTVAEIEAGRLRGLAQRLSKQYLLYQLHLGDMSKSELVETATRIDRILHTLQAGSPSYSVPAAWNTALQKQVAKVDGLWGALRRIAVASPYDSLRVSREFVSPEARRKDPLLLRYFDGLTAQFIEESETLLDLYHEECVKTRLEVCATAQTAGLAAMVIERAAKEAVHIVAGLDADEHRKQLDATVEAYKEIRKANQASTFFAEALNPERGPSAEAAGALLASLRADWDAMQGEFTILAAGDEENFDLPKLLAIQSQLVDKVERMTAALVRYASLAYGS